MPNSCPGPRCDPVILRHQGLGFLVTEDNRFFSDLLEHHVDPAIEDLLADILKKRPITWETIRTLRETHSLGNKDLSVLILPRG